MSPGSQDPPGRSSGGPRQAGGRHLDRQLLDGYVTGERSVVDVIRAGLEHLGAGNAEEAPGRDRASEQRLVRQLSRSLRATRDEESRERDAAPELADELLRQETFAALAAVREERRFQTLAVVEALLDWSWLCLEHRAPGLARSGLELCQAVHRSLDPLRYERPALRRAEAFRRLLEGRVELAEGNVREAQASLRESSRAADALDFASDDRHELECGLALAHAGLVLRFRHPIMDALFLRQLSLDDLANSFRTGAGRWAPALAANLAWVARRREGPDAALARVEALWDRDALARRPEGPSPSAVWAVRELLWCLAATDRVQEGISLLTSWSGTGVEPGDPELADRLFVAGSFWSVAGGSPELVGPPLEQAYRRFLDRGRGLDAALTAVELCRFYRGLGQDRGAGEAVRDVAQIARCPDVPGAVVAALARLAEEAVCARLGDAELNTLEDLLIAARAGWGPVLDEDDAET